LAVGDFDGLPLPSGSDIATNGAFHESLWARPLPRHLTRYIDEEPDGEDRTVVRMSLRLFAFARYLNQRMAVTVEVTQAENHALDMSEALNTTGRPLTASETFGPKVIEAEGLDAYLEPSGGWPLLAQVLPRGACRRADRQSRRYGDLMPIASTCQSMFL
jgi:hypothetical protein